jgi:hypothetical protein
VVSKSRLTKKAPCCISGLRRRCLARGNLGIRRLVALFFRLERHHTLTTGTSCCPRPPALYCLSWAFNRMSASFALNGCLCRFLQCWVRLFRAFVYALTCVLFSTAGISLIPTAFEIICSISVFCEYVPSLKDKNLREDAFG